MPARPAELAKAVLQEITWNRDQQVQVLDKSIEVQFNPESLKVSLTNQKSNDDQRGGSSTQYVGQGTSKLSFDLWFDVSAPPPRRTGADGTVDTSAVTDVRRLSREVGYFMEPRRQDDGKYIAPGVRFSWGSFRFDGTMESLNETLDFFSADGRPLRAQISVTLSQQQIVFAFGDSGAAPRPANAPPTQPQRPARENESVQSIAGESGRQDQWQGDALRNGIENPRRLSPGTSLDLSAASRASVSPSLGVTLPSGATVTRRLEAGTSAATAVASASGRR